MATDDKTIRLNLTAVHALRETIWKAIDDAMEDARLPFLVSNVVSVDPRGFAVSLELVLDERFHREMELGVGLPSAHGAVSGAGR